MYTMNRNCKHSFATASNQLPADHELVRLPRMTGNVLHLSNSLSFSNAVFQENEEVHIGSENDHQLHDDLHTPEKYILDEVACEQPEQCYVNVLQPSNAQHIRITEL